MRKNIPITKKIHYTSREVKNKTVCMELIVFIVLLYVKEYLHINNSTNSVMLSQIQGRVHDKGFLEPQTVIFHSGSTMMPFKKLFGKYST